MTPATQASSSSGVPVFTYVKSARSAFSRSGQEPRLAVVRAPAAPRLAAASRAP